MTSRMRKSNFGGDRNTRAKLQFIKSFSSGALATPLQPSIYRLGMCNLLEGIYPPHLRIPWHRHQVAHCTYVLAGGYLEKGSHSGAFLQSGDLLFHPKREVHCDLIGDEGARCINIEFATGDALVRALEAMSQRTEQFSTKLRCAARSELSGKVSTEWSSDGPRSRNQIQRVTRFCGAVRNFLWRTVQTDVPLWLKKCIDELEKRAPLAPPLKELAAIAELHPTHVVRSFGLYLGQTPGQYMRARRVSLACELLSNSTNTLVEVALACGFYDQAHFGRVFCAAIGQTPGQFRDQSRERNNDAR
jgi:AraC family transcriptional regulator